MNPWDDFLARIEEPEGTNLYPGLVQGIQAPALVMVPDEPWIESDGFQYDIERYLVIALAEGASPGDALAKIHALVHAVRDASGAGWEIGNVSGVRNATIPNDGTSYLGAWINVTYRDCTHSVEEGS